MVRSNITALDRLNQIALAACWWSANGELPYPPALPRLFPLVTYVPWWMLSYLAAVVRVSPRPTRFFRSRDVPAGDMRLIGNT